MAEKNLRNFAIIAHIDHGKSTLADRFLELTQTVESKKMKAQFLDQMDLEREKGITIKLQPVRMEYSLDNKEYILNLIDTPGHVDFSYEVSRSLAVCDGAILLIDATQGVQAQTLANLHLAENLGLKIIPAINKIDSPVADIDKTKEEIKNILGQIDVSLVSAKTGQGVEDILARVVKKIPEPKVIGDNLKAMIFDSWFDSFQGVIAAVKVVSGQLQVGDKLKMLGTKVECEASELGYFLPARQKQKQLTAGEIGYIVTGLKSVKECRVGDTIINSQQTSRIKPLAGFKKVKPVVFSEFYPVDGKQHKDLTKALEKLSLNDASLVLEPVNSQVLGFGFRLGFLGLLHLEIVKERLDREFGQEVVITNPTVSYRVCLRGGQTKTINNPAQFPDLGEVEKVEQPMVEVEIITNQKYLGKVMETADKFKGEYQALEYLSKTQAKLIYQMPLAKVITGFYDTLKGVSSGYASLSYEPIGLKEADIVKLDILIAGQIEQAFSQLVFRDEATKIGRQILLKLKKLLPQQLWSVPLQASLGGSVIARENIRARGKDVTAKLYGGDRSRKDKLLKKQKAGKKKLATKGRVEVPASVYLDVLKNN